MGTNFAPLVADLFLFCYERDFMMSLSQTGDKQADIIYAFNTTSRYLDDILNINNVHYDTMGWSDFLLYDGSDLKTYLLKKW